MKKMLITGGTGAIGSMTAYLGVRQGWQVVLAYHSSHEAAANLKEDLEKIGGTVTLFCGDLTQKEDREKLAAVCGRVDLLVNNFGTAHYAAFTEETDETLNEVLQTNLLSHMALTRLLLPEMLSVKCGSIVNISSVWGQTGGSCEVAYSAAKAGLIGFTKAMAQETGPSHVRVNCIAPGVIETDMLKCYSQEDLQALADETPLQRLGSPVDVAQAAVFLSGQNASFITGQVLGVNGGFVV